MNSKADSSQNVLRLAWVSLLNDISSDALLRAFPLYISGVLGAPVAAIGVIEGLAEASATLLKPVFGRISDRWGKRKGFVAWGYGLSALSRPLLAFAGSWPQAGALRIVDRIGKSVRTGPRDALIADSTGPSGRHGRSFGLNRAFDTLGGVLSVGALYGWLRWHGTVEISRESWRFLCLAMSLPGVVAVVLVALGIQDVARLVSTKTGSDTPLSPQLKRYLVCAGLFALANSSDAFVLLRLKELGYSLPATLVLVALNQLVSSFSSLPAAALSDHWGRKPLLTAGWVIYAVCYALLGSPVAAQGLLAVAPIIALYGLFYGFTEGVEKAWVADLAPPEGRGRAFGVFGLVVGGLAFPASTAFGLAWERWGSGVSFGLAAGLAAAATASLYLLNFNKTAAS
jgi:MFS family permease